MKKVRFTQRLRYQFDNLMARGTGALLGTLALATLFIILLGSLLVQVTKASPETGFIEIVWMSMNRTLDAGTLGGDTGSALFLFFMFIMTLAGIFIISMLIGLLNNAIESKLEALRKGRSKVLEQNHTVILGWSESIFTILSELIEANSNKKKSCIVILGNKDKVEMDDEIKERITDRKTTSIVTRQGNPIDIDDLEIVSLNTAKSIIILDTNDSNVIKTILAITNNPAKRSEPYHIVATLQSLKNVDVARIAGQNQVELICTDNLIARIMAQTCRQPGLSTVYTELLDFGGDEIYFTQCPSLVGKTFGEALLMFEDSAVIGLCKGSKTMINPGMDILVEAGDQIIAISQDDDTVVPMKEAGSPDTRRMNGLRPTKTPSVEKTLLLGWNETAAKVILELDNYVGSGSLLTVVGRNVDEEAFTRLSASLKNQKAEHIRENSDDREVLDRLAAHGYDHIIILCDSSKEVQDADSITLITLLHLRDIAEKTGRQFSIVSEIMDFRNKKLAEITKVNDFIVSEKLVSLILSQVSENRLLNGVFEDLFDADGSEIYVKPSSQYVLSGEPINFFTVTEAARRHGEIAIGYIQTALLGIAAEGYGIRINPSKSDMITFSENDKVIVISEE